ncbi:MAG: hypothetical protein LBG80_02775 [Bacteroidales bacterium]|jgi:hypothetical protein|nr:hypothetical protein [Bacteroidales bacterium]
MKIRISIFVFFLTLSQLSFGQIAEGGKKTQWDYPVKPGSEEWKKFKSNKEMVDACQIPGYILQNISTSDLMTLCLQYPLLYNVFAFANKNDGLKKLFADFNGIREFSKREGAIDKLREAYLAELSIFPCKLDTCSILEEIGYSILHISMLEMLISYSDFYTNSTTKDKKKEVLESLLYGYLEKIKYPNYFRRIGLTSNLYARVHIILKIDASLSDKFEEKNKSVLSSGMARADLIDTIDRLSYELIK